MVTPDKKRSGSIANRSSGGAPVFRTGSGQLVEARPGVKIELDDVNRPVDICIVFDTTGSMEDKIAGLVSSMVGFVNELDKLKLDWRFTMVPFGDLTVPGDRIVTELSFVSDADAAVHMIRGMPRFNGGGNSGESSLEAMQAAMQKAYRNNTVKVIVLLTDEPPLQHQYTTGSISASLKQGEFVCFVVSIPGHGYQEMAEINAGSWNLIGSHLDTAQLLAFFRKLLADVAHVSRAVHELGGGSVPRYIEQVKLRELGGK